MPRLRLFVRLLLLVLLCTGCGRKLTDGEVAFVARLQGDAIDTGRVRLVPGAPLNAVTFRRQARPRKSCRERILPPSEGDTVTVRPVAVTLLNTVHFTDDWYLDDYLQGWPDRVYLVPAMLFAHEMTHVWQWQNRRITGYSPLRAAAEHGRSDDPYLFELDGAPEFLSFGYEQQGAIVEEYVCCRALAPQAARTKRLHAMLKGAFPVTDLPARGRESDVYLPWKGAELNGICA